MTMCRKWVRCPPSCHWPSAPPHRRCEQPSSSKFPPPLHHPHHIALPPSSLSSALSLHPHPVGVGVGRPLTGGDLAISTRSTLTPRATAAVVGVGCWALVPRSSTSSRPVVMAETHPQTTLLAVAHRCSGRRHVVPPPQPSALFLRPAVFCCLFFPSLAHMHQCSSLRAVARRHGSRCCVVTSNLATKKWNNTIRNKNTIKRSLPRAQTTNGRLGLRCIRNDSWDLLEWKWEWWWWWQV
jgi:hypothetical protein